MWLRSERREKRPRSCSNRQNPIKSIIKKSPQIPKLSKNINGKHNKNQFTNPKPPIVKRLGNRSDKKTKIILPIKLTDDCKENCWLENNDVTLFDTNSKTSCIVDGSNKPFEKDIGYPSDSLNCFGPIVLDSTITSSCCSCEAATTKQCGGNGGGGSSSSSSSIHCSDSSYSNTNLMTCISECDSTTDYDPESNNFTQTVALSTIITENFSNENSLRNLDIIEPEVDSTTDLLQEEPESTLSLECYQKKERELPKLNLPSSSFYHNFSNIDSSQSSKQFPIFPNNANNSNFPATPDIISMFDEEINKGSTTDIVYQYSDFMQNNQFYTQSYFNCNENCSSNCSQSMNNMDEASFLSMNQTAIDNLKALSNFQTHNFLASVSLPKSNENEAAGSFIHSAEQNTDEVNKISETNDCRLETDESLETDEGQDSRQVLTWSSFDPYVFIKQLPPLTKEMRAECPALPLKTRSSPEFSLVLDLDETLVHCSLQELSDASFKFPVLFQVRFFFISLVSTGITNWVFFFLYRIANIQFSFEPDHFSVNFLKESHKYLK